MEHPFVIIGGGIGGLATANALNHLGIRARVFEASTELKAVGAGLTLTSNAIFALSKMGLQEKVLQAGKAFDTFFIRDEKGKLINKVDTSVLPLKHNFTNVAIHRADLQNILLENLQPGQLVTGKKSKSIEIIDEGYRIYFNDGSFEDCMYLIIAEGIHSSLRKYLVPDSTIRFAGYTCWRGIATNPGNDIEEVLEIWGDKGRFGIVPVGNGKVYWFATINADRQNSDLKNFTVEDLADHFKGYGNGVLQVLKATASHKIIWNDIIDLKPLKKFTNGKMVLMGDAAHATTPNIGQGACMAIEDAAVLAHCLKNHSYVSEAFKNFEQIRIARTTYIVKRSWLMGRIAQWEKPIFVRLRNLLLRMIPEKISAREMQKIFSFQV